MPGSCRERPALVAVRPATYVGVMERRTGAVSITSARTARSADISGRQTRYIMSMAIRTLCFIGAVVTDGVLRWVLVAGAIFLPYVAVVMANAGVQKEPLPPEAFTTPGQPELDGGAPPTGS